MFGNNGSVTLKKFCYLRLCEPCLLYTSDAADEL